jgi:hypothetical protein
MGYIVTNKGLRAGYGEPLRAYFASEGVIEEVVDFGHAPIFEDADVFPCIVLLRKPLRDESQTDRSVRVVEFPREALNGDIAAYVRENAHIVPKKRFGKNAWSLETSAVDDLMEKIRHNGVPLAEFAGVKPYRGVLTGLNEAFLIDTSTKERLVREDPRLGRDHQALPARPRHKALVPRVARALDHRPKVQRRPPLAVDRCRQCRRHLPPNLPIASRLHEAARREASQTPR